MIRQNKPEASKQTKPLRGCADIDTTLCAQTTPRQTADELRRDAVFSERELTLTFATCYRPSVCRL